MTFKTAASLVVAALAAGTAAPAQAAPRACSYMNSNKPMGDAGLGGLPPVVRCLTADGGVWAYGGADKPQLASHARLYGEAKATAVADIGHMINEIGN